jgi:hypothetical protein
MGKSTINGHVPVRYVNLPEDLKPSIVWIKKWINMDQKSGHGYPVPIFLPDFCQSEIA